MAKYKIAVIGHLLKNNKVAKFGEEVDESQLTSPAKDLVKEGFITEIEAKEVEVEVEVEETETEIDTEEEVEEVIVLDSKTEETEIDDIETLSEEVSPKISKKDEVKNSLKK